MISKALPPLPAPASGPSSRDAPRYYVKIVVPGQGAAGTVDKTDRVLSFTFDDDEAKADKLELELDNFDLALFDDPHWLHGNKLVVSWGYVGNMAPPRTMHIGKITGSRSLKIEALAETILMNKDPLSRHWEHMKPSEILAEIAAKYGMPVATKFTEVTQDLTNKNYGNVSKAFGTNVAMSLQQAKLTDAQFLAQLAKKNGLVFNIKADGLHFEPRNFGAAPRRVFRYYTDPGRGEVLDFSLENDVTMAPGAVHAKGRDPKAKADIHEVAGNAETPRDGHAPFTHTVSVRDGTTQTVAIAQDAVVLSTASTAQVAKAQADAKYVRAQQATVKLTLSVIGDPTLAAGQVIEIQGLGKRLSGKYCIKSAKHKLTASGYTLDLGCCTDGSHVPTAAQQRSDASPNTQPVGDPKELKPVVVVVDQRSGTTYRR